MKLLIKEIHRKDKNIIIPLIGENKFNPYSNVKFYNDIGRLNEYYYNIFFCLRGIRILSAVLNNETVGLLTFSLSKWDSDIFGMKMAKIIYIVSKGGYDKELMVKNRLLDKAIEYLKSSGVKLITTRVEAGDFSSLHSIENHKFKIMDNLANYILRKRIILFPDASRWFAVSKMQRRDLGVSADMFANAGIRSHFFIDPYVPLVKAKNMYRKWLKCVFRNQKDSDIFVAKRDNVIVGCSFFSFNRLLADYTGLKSLHRGLIAIDSSSPGCFIAFINASMMKKRRLDFAEFETQTYNYKMVEVLQKLGAQLIGLRYTFHRKL